MQAKSKIKLGILLILVIGIIVGGIVMLRRIDHNKQVFDIELTGYVPDSTRSVLQINKHKSLGSFLPLCGNLATVIDAIKNDLSYPFYVLSDKKQVVCLAKITIEQEMEIKRRFSANFFSDYAPKERKYKDATLLFYPTSDNSFFCCTFYNGLFIGSYNYKVIETMVDHKNTGRYFAKAGFDTLGVHIKSSFAANWYIATHDRGIGFNISVKDDSLHLEGYSQLTQMSAGNDSLNLNSLGDRSVLPNVLRGYQIVFKDALVSDSIGSYFDPTAYQFFGSDSKYPVSVLRCVVDKFVVYNYLNDLEAKFTGKRFNINDFAYPGQRIYTASSQLSEDIFRKPDIVYFTFYKNHLCFSTDKKTLIDYLHNSGNNHSDHAIQVQLPTDVQVRSVFYANSVRDLGYHTLDSTLVNTLAPHYHNISVSKYIEDGYQITNVLLSK